MKYADIIAVVRGVGPVLKEQLAARDAAIDALARRVEWLEHQLAHSRRGREDEAKRDAS